MRALRRLNEIEEDERKTTNRFDIFTPRGSRAQSLSAHRRTSEDESSVSAAGSQAGHTADWVGSEYSSRSQKRSSGDDYQSSSRHSRRSSRTQKDRVDTSEDSYQRALLANAWKIEKADLVKKIEDQMLEYTRLKRDKESQEKDSTQKDKKMKILSDQESKSKEDEKETRKSSKT